MVNPYIRDFSLNPSDFESGFVSVARAFLFSTQSFLRSFEFLIVFVKSFGIGNFFTRTQGNQAANPNIQTYGTIDWLHGGIGRIVNPQTDKPTARRVALHRNSCGFASCWQLPGSSNGQRLRTLCQINLSLFPLESRFGKFCAAATALFLEVGVFCPTRKEIAKCRLQVSQSLLQRYTTYLIQKLEVFKFFPLCQHSRGWSVVNLLLSFMPSFCSCCQRSVKYQPHATNCPTQQRFLLEGWVTTVAVGFFHISHSTTDHVKPSSKDGVSTQICDDAE